MQTAETRTTAPGAGAPLKPGIYRTPGGRHVEVVGTIIGDRVVYVRLHDGSRGVLPGAFARKVLTRVNKPYLGEADDPRGGMTVVVGVVMLFVVGLLALAAWIAPKVEWQ